MTHENFLFRSRTYRTSCRIRPYLVTRRAVVLVVLLEHPSCCILLYPALLYAPMSVSHGLNQATEDSSHNRYNSGCSLCYLFLPPLLSLYSSYQHVFSLMFVCFIFISSIVTLHIIIFVDCVHVSLCCCCCCC